MAGIRVAEPAGRRWLFQPHFGDLGRAEAGFVTGLGKIRGAWERGQAEYVAVVDTPVGTRGVLRLPVVSVGGDVVVTVNGGVVAKDGYGIQAGHAVLEVDGGKYDIRVSG